MAAVAPERICPACRRRVDGDPPMCPMPCLNPRPPAGWPAPAPPPPPEEEPAPAATAAATGPIRCPNPSCGAEVPAARDECLYCGTRLGGSGSWVVEVAGHPVTIGPGRSVLVGRADPSPLARALEPKANVSRRHCELRVQGGLQVRDVGSTNGTYIDDRAVGPEWEDVPAGGRLRLASDVDVRVSRRG